MRTGFFGSVGGMSALQPQKETSENAMKDRLLLKEAEIIKEDLHYYNFIKSIIRLFSVRFRNTVSSVGSCRILDTCGTGGNGIVYRVSSLPLKIPYLSYYMIDLFHLSKEHMHDDPYEKIDEITQYFDSVEFEVRNVSHRRRTDFYCIGEERSYGREFFSLEAMKGCSSTVSLCDYGTFELVSKSAERPDQSRELAFFLTPLFQGISLKEMADSEKTC